MGRRRTPIAMPHRLRMEQSVADKINRHNAQLHQLESVMNIQRLDKQGRLNRRLVRKQQDGTLHEETEEPEDTEDDTIQFGDNIYYIGGQKPENAEPTPQPQEQPRNVAPAEQPAAEAQAAPASKLASVWPWVLAAALGGSGLGMGALALPTLLNPPKATTVVAPELGKDYELDFRNGDTKPGE